MRRFLAFVAAFWISLALGLWLYLRRDYPEIEPDDPALFV